MTTTYLRIASIFAAALAADVLTKAWAQKALPLFVPVPVFGEVFRFTLGYNYGVAFGLLATEGPWVLLLSGAATLLIAAWLVHQLRTGDATAAMTWGASLLLGGAAANLLDRAADRRVTDFLDLGLGASRWPTFNLADVFILSGVFLLLLSSTPAQPQAPADPSGDQEHP